jgi:hypothetical protein
MRIDKQNRRGCIIFALALAAIAALVLWASLGGVQEESIGDDVQGGMSATGAPLEPGAPPGAGAPPPAGRRGS